MTGLSKCCVTGFKWHGEPQGRESTIAGHQAYITGSNPDRAILFIHDGLGWRWENTRLLADHFAEEVDATVYVPDFFDDKPISRLFLSLDPKDPSDPRWAELDLPGFMARNSKELRSPQLLAVARSLRSQYKRLGGVGYCWGGWANFSLGGAGNDLLDCLSVSHPSLLTKEEIDAVDCPVQINAPEHDGLFTPELKEYFLKKAVEKGLRFDYQYYPGQSHGFAAKGNDEDEVERKAMVRAKNAAVAWFQNWLVLD